MTINNIQNSKDLQISCSICVEEHPSIGALYQGHFYSEKIFHGFHPACLSRWLEQRYSCPLCREPLVPENPDITKIAREGLTDILQSLLTSGMSMTSEQKGQAIQEAAAHGHAAIVELLYREATPILPEGHAETLMAALESEHIQENLIEFLLNQRIELDQGTRGSAVTTAVQNGLARIVHLLLPAGAEIDPEDRGFAVIAAAENEDAEMLEFLLPQGSEISEEDYAHALKTTVESDDERSVRFLLSRHVALEEENYGAAVIEACRTGNTRIAELLLSSEFSLNSEDRETALNFSALNGMAGAFQLLWKEDEELPSKEMILSIAAKYGHRNIIEFLHPQGLEPERELLEETLITASKHNQLHLVNFLLETWGPFSQETFEEALVEASRKDALSSMQRLLSQDISFSPEALSEASEIARERGVQDIIELLEEYRF